jgi:hypothetical protein
MFTGQDGDCTGNPWITGICASAPGLDSIVGSEGAARGLGARHVRSIRLAPNPRAIPTERPGWHGGRGKIPSPVDISRARSLQRRVFEKLVLRVLRCGGGWSVGLCVQPAGRRAIFGGGYVVILYHQFTLPTERVANRCGTAWERGVRRSVKLPSAGLGEPPGAANTPRRLSPRR